MSDDYDATREGREQARLQLARLVRNLLDEGYGANVFASPGNGYTRGRRFCGVETDEGFTIKITTDRLRREDFAKIALIASIYGLEPTIMDNGQVHLVERRESPTIRKVYLP